MEILTVRDLSFTYAGEMKKALDGISFSVKEGEFLVLCGESGCGKTTLLKLLKRELSPYGVKEGSILFSGRPLEEMNEKQAAREIGFVMQNPESQIITDKVWHELAFGLESLGTDHTESVRRISETACFFGIDDWFDRKTSELSGGQKQLLNLASAMVMQPSLLLLDEPTARLDPIAASHFLTTLEKINKELGLTILMSEHRLEDVLPMADRLAVMENGRILALEKPRDAALKLKNIRADHRMLAAVPSAVRIFEGVASVDESRAPAPGDSSRTFTSGDSPQAFVPGDSSRTFTAGDSPQAFVPGDSSRTFTAGDSPQAFVPGDCRKEFESCPLTVREGRDFLSENFGCKIDRLPREENATQNKSLAQADNPMQSETLTQNKDLAQQGKPLKNEHGASGRHHEPASAISVQDVFFRYEKDEPDILSGLNLEVRQGEIFSLLGSNGAGKTTLLSVISGIRKAYSGKVKILGKDLEKYTEGELYRHLMASLPQDPTSVFLEMTLRKDYEEMQKALGCTHEEMKEKIEQISVLLGLQELLDRHPYDLSGGEQQKAALGKVLLLEPKILLLDEPSNGLDAWAKIGLSKILHTLKMKGITILMVTHDLEFAAGISDRCAMFFNHGVFAEGTPEEFFCGNNFYTTAANRISRHMYKNAYTCEDVIALCRMNGRK